jgi:glycosyltransferase involved in cell wall biosynthesis
VHDTWVVLPAYDEHAVVAEVVRALRTVFPNVVCVDDGSRDDSARRAREAGAVVLSHPLNLGQGAALQTGLTYALGDERARFFVTFDADGQHQVSDAVALVERLRAGDVDVVFGSRFIDRRSHPGAVKTLVLRTAAVYSRAVTGVRLTDAHNGLRAFNRKAAEALEIRQARMAHATEIITQVRQRRLRYAELPVHVLYTDYSRSKGQSLLNSVNIVVDLMFR